MYDLDKAYSKKFFAQRKSLSWRVPIVCDAIIDVLKPKSVIDVGCGNGDLLRGFHDKGIKILGIEGTKNYSANTMLPLIEVDEYVSLYPICIHDFRKKGFVCGKFDLAICFEVAEHIELEYTDIFLDNLCSLSDRILFSAAGPGQGGIHHHNCQHKVYWINKINAKGYICNFKIITKLQERWYPWQNKKGIKAYYQNLMYFERKV